MRHHPEAIGLELDNSGWVEIATLVSKGEKAGFKISESIIRHVVTISDKQRFKISDDGLRIRANQGHSVRVDLGLQAIEPPEFLYHGTAQHNLASICREGIKRSNRNHVHLSAERETAVKVSARHGQAVVLIVMAAKMSKDGKQFFSSENGVWLTEFVAPEYLERSKP